MEMKVIEEHSAIRERVYNFVGQSNEKQIVVRESDDNERDWGTRELKYNELDLIKEDNVQVRAGRLLNDNHDIRRTSIKDGRSRVNSENSP